MLRKPPFSSWLLEKHRETTNQPKENKTEKKRLVYLVKLGVLIIEKAREIIKIISFCFIVAADGLESVVHYKLWKILKDTGIPVHCTCLLWNKYSDQDITITFKHGKMKWFKIRKDMHQHYLLSPSLFNFCAEYIMESNLLDESQAGNKISVRNMK